MRVLFCVAITAYKSISSHPMVGYPTVMQLAELSTQCMLREDSPSFDEILRTRSMIELQIRYMPALEMSDASNGMRVGITDYLRHQISGITLEEPEESLVEIAEQMEGEANPKPIWTPKSLYRELKSRVIGQDAACRVLATRGYMHLKRAELLKSGENVGKNECLLFLGDSGSGKTMTCETYASLCNTPFASTDATAASSIGFCGIDLVESSLKNLLKACGKNDGIMERFRTGINFIDEYTKR